MFLFLGEFPTFFSTACCSMSSSAPLSACWFESPPSPIMMSNFVSSRKYEIHAYSERKTLVLRKTVSRLQVCVLCWTAKAAGLKFPHQTTNHPPLPTQPTRSKQPKLPSIAWLFGGAKAWRGGFRRPLLGVLHTSFNRYSFLFWGTWIAVSMKESYFMIWWA